MSTKTGTAPLVLANAALTVWLPFSGLVWPVTPLVSGSVVVLWFLLSLAGTVGLVLLWGGSTRRGRHTWWRAGMGTLVALWVVGLARLMLADTTQPDEVQVKELSASLVWFTHLVAGALLVAAAATHRKVSASSAAPDQVAPSAPVHGGTAAASQRTVPPAWPGPPAASPATSAAASGQGAPAAAGPRPPAGSQPTKQGAGVPSGREPHSQPRTEPLLRRWDAQDWFTAVLLASVAFFAALVGLLLILGYDAEWGTHPTLWVFLSLVLAGAAATCVCLFVPAVRTRVSARHRRAFRGSGLGPAELLGAAIDAFAPVIGAAIALAAGIFSVGFAIDGGSPGDFFADTASGALKTLLVFAVIGVGGWLVPKLVRALTNDHGVNLTNPATMSCEDLMELSYAMDKENKVRYADVLRLRARDSHCAVCTSRGARSFFEKWSYE